MKHLLRRIALLPFHPSVFVVMLYVLRFAKVLPKKTRDLCDPPQRILIVNLTNFVGDTVMMMPLLDCLHAAIPDAKIDVVTSSAMLAFVRNITYLKDVYGLQIQQNRIPIWNEYQKLARMVCLTNLKLYDESYDLCLLPRWGIDPNMSAFLASMTSAARILGYDPGDEAGVRNPFPGIQRLFTCHSKSSIGQPEGIRELQLLEVCGIAKQLDLTAEEAKPISTLLQIAQHVSLPILKSRLKVDDTPYIVMAPGASHAARRWPPEHFAAIATYLYSHYRLQTLIIGGPSDATISKSIIAHAEKSVCDLIGKTNLPDTIALLSGTVLLLTNDSGPAHIGAGLGIPTVILSACPLTSTQEHSNSPLRVRPVRPKVYILQPPNSSSGCNERCVANSAHCILGLTVPSVLRAMEQIILPQD